MIKDVFPSSSFCFCYVGTLCWAWIPSALVVISCCTDHIRYFVVSERSSISKGDNNILAWVFERFFFLILHHWEDLELMCSTCMYFVQVYNIQEINMHSTFQHSQCPQWVSNPCCIPDHTTLDWTNSAGNIFEIPSSLT